MTNWVSDTITLIYKLHYLRFIMKMPLLLLYLLIIIHEVLLTAPSLWKEASLRQFTIITDGVRAKAAFHYSLSSGPQENGLHAFGELEKNR